MVANIRRLLVGSLVVQSTAFVLQKKCARKVTSGTKGPAVNFSRVAATVSPEENGGDGLVTRLRKSTSGRKITLIGTAHLSRRSNEQVASVIESERPDAVLIEIDRTRLPRLGLTEDDLGRNFVTAEDIVPALLEDDRNAAANKRWWDPVVDIMLDASTGVARKIITGAYDEMGKQMGELKAGGEFVVAVDTAKKIDPNVKIILGDRDSMVTIRRAAELAVRSGDPLKVLSRFNAASEDEMKLIEGKVRKEMGEIDEKEISVAVVEALKSDEEFRTRLFLRLEKDVPEFTRSFLTERDYIMSEAIGREETASHVVAVVGLAHVLGMTVNLKQKGFEEYIL